MSIVVNIFLFFIISVSIYIAYKLKWRHYYELKNSFLFLFSNIYTTESQDPGKLSHLQTLLLSLGGTIGIGNITGVVLAISIGGPGAIFWIWVSAFLGMSIKFASVFLALKFRIFKDNHIIGGLMFIYRNKLKIPWLGNIIALFTLFVCLYMGNFVQSEAILKGFTFIVPELDSFDIYIIGFFLSIAVGFVISDGILKISKRINFLVPFMLIFYMFSCLWIIFIHIENIFTMFYLIFSSAFSLQSVGSGFLASFFILSFREGLLRGFFSNESPFGSSNMAHIMVKTKHIHKQALIAMLEPFIDSFIICSLTAFVLILTDSWNLKASLYHPFEILSKAFQNGFLVFFEEESLFFASMIIGMSIVLFAYSTIITWSYYGEQVIAYFFGIENKYVFYIYRICYMFVTFLGSILTFNTLNHWIYYLNFLIIIPHLVVLIIFLPEIQKDSQLNLKKFKKDL